MTESRVSQQPPSTELDPWGVAAKDAEADRLVRTSRSFGQQAFASFVRKPTAVAGVIIVLILGLLAAFGPSRSPYDYDSQDLSQANLSPVMTAYRSGDLSYAPTSSLKVFVFDESSRVTEVLSKGEDDPVHKRITFTTEQGEEVTLNYRVKPAEILVDGKQLKESHRVWNRDHLFGTDSLGRDMLTRLMFGMRISLLIAVIAMAVNLLIGVVCGGIAGFAGGMTDSVLMRFVDVVSTIPLILYVVLIQVLLVNSTGFASIVIALSTVYWVDMARVVRGQVLSLKEQEFVAAARTMGSGSAWILRKHLLPHLTGTIIVTATMLIPAAIFIEAFMSFIGLGVAPPMASLGTMASDALGTLRSSPYQLFFPAGAIVLLMFAFNFIGDGLRDALDPKQWR